MVFEPIVLSIFLQNDWTRKKNLLDKPHQEFGSWLEKNKLILKSFSKEPLFV
jgi:hypothetical protein